MTAHMHVPAVDPTPNSPISLSKNGVTKLLKEDLGFEGLVITDGLGMSGVTKFYDSGEATLKAFLAGSDLLLCPVDVEQAFRAIEQAVINGFITQEEIDKRVLKILCYKHWAMDHAQETPEDLYGALNTAAAYALKEQLYEKAVTVVHDSGDLIPLTQSELPIPVIQIGAAADNQFLAALEHAAHIRVNSLSAKPTANNIQKTIENVFDNQIIVVTVHGMNKFASKNFGVDPNAIRLIKKLKELNKKVLLVIFGNPYSIPLFGKTDTLVIAYEDDESAHRAAGKVLAGSIAASGTLPVTL